MAAITSRLLSGQLDNLSSVLDVGQKPRLEIPDSVSNPTVTPVDKGLLGLFVVVANEPLHLSVMMGSNPIRLVPLRCPPSDVPQVRTEEEKEAE